MKTIFLVFIICLGITALYSEQVKHHKEEMTKLDSIYTQLQNLELVDQ